MTINERVKRIRLTLNLTQKEMGQRLTLAQTYLSQIEKGDRDVTDKIFKIICLELNVREEYLRDGIEPMFNENEETIISEVAAQYHLGDLDKAIMKAFLELSPEEREAFKEFAFSLVNTVLSDKELYMEYCKKHNMVPPAARNSDTTNIADYDNSSGDDIGTSIDELEAEYKKSVLHSAQNTGSSALNITNGTEASSAVNE